MIVRINNIRKNIRKSIRVDIPDDMLGNGRKRIKAEILANIIALGRDSFYGYEVCKETHDLGLVRQVVIRNGGKVIKEKGRNRYFMPLEEIKRRVKISEETK